MLADLVKVTIDGLETMVPKGTLIVEAAKQVGIDIPVFCYHEKMKPVGACRMCLVEIEKVPRPQTACSTPVNDGMIVRTNTPAIDKARKGVLEFLLTNHPLDCPVCDKGGECPLQDTTFRYACDRSRFGEEKRHFQKPIRLSDLIVLDRERCIMCTRCVRFVREIAGDESLTLVNRGSRSYVGVMPTRTFDSPFSGNTVELCPVGALTSAKFRFRARSWELLETPSICTGCSVGCNVKVESKSGEVMRLTARENTPVDDGWLCDRGRFNYDYVNSADRLTTPYVRKNGALVAASWREALEAASSGIRQVVRMAGGGAVGGVVSPSASNEELYLFQKMLRALVKSNNVDHGLRGGYLPPEHGIDAATGSIAGLEAADILLLIGTNVIDEQPVLDLRVKKAAWQRRARVISASVDATDISEISSPWMQIAAGTETAVVNGLVNLLLGGGIAPEVARERLGERLETIARGAAEFSAERVQEVAGVDVASLRQVAELLATTSKVAVLFPRAGDGGSAELQTACGRLADLLGCTHEPSGGLYPLGRSANSQGAIDLGVVPNRLPGQRSLDGDALRQLDKLWGAPLCEVEGLSGAQMVEAAAQGDLKALYISGMDPAGNIGSQETKSALSKLECLIVQDCFMTETARMAHVVFPAATFAEMDGSYTNLERRVQRTAQAVPLHGESHPGWRIVADLAVALGATRNYATAADVFGELVQAVPLYEGLSFKGLGDKGMRWQLPGEAAKPSQDGRTRKLWYRPVEPAQTEVEGSGV